MRLRRPELIPWCVFAVLLPLLATKLGVAWPVMLLIGLGIVVLVAILGEIQPAARRPAPRQTFDERPPDGVVPIVEVPGLRRHANGLQPVIGPFDKSAGLALGEGHRRLRRGRTHFFGQIGVASLFVGRDGNAWDEREIVEAYGAMERAGRWLESEAKRWGVPLNIERLATYFVAVDDVEELVELIPDGKDPFENMIDEQDANLKELNSATRAAAALGFPHLPGLIESVGNLAEHDALVWVVYLMRSGRSSAIIPGVCDLPGDGITICYARDASFSEPLVGLPYVDPATLAHEMLHLFGATDKYGTSLKRFPERSVTRKDVMRDEVDRLGRMRIDPLTAAELGWGDAPHGNAVD